MSKFKYFVRLQQAQSASLAFTSLFPPLFLTKCFKYNLSSFSLKTIKFQSPQRTEMISEINTCISKPMQKYFAWLHTGN